MWRFIKSPQVRISFGLVMLTVTMLLISDVLGLVPDPKNAELRYRKVIAESIAVQLSTEIAERKQQRVESILRSMVERNDSVLSAAVRMGEGKPLSEYGNHGKYWTLRPGDKSTPTQLQVSLYNEKKLWGTVELSFKPLGGTGGWLSFQNSFLGLVLFMALMGFLSYLLFLKRTLSELNPDAVIPERVRKALDTLAEGLLIIDKDNNIIFSNTSFASKLSLSPQQLVGKHSSKLEWKTVSDDDDTELPWLRVLAGQELPEGIKIRLKSVLEAAYTFSVNASSITTPSGEVRGVLVTFNDITEIEKKNEELRRTFGKLEKSQREITRQNRELQVLATRDPLTGILNRRSLSQGFETLFVEAQEHGEELCCIMVDIDHFKLVNDRFGHAVGDIVIKLLAKILTEHSRPNDLVGRYGGEEFLLVLPGVGAEIASGIAERIRQAVEHEKGGGQLSSALSITSSFGVATLSDRTNSASELLEQADKALYVAKERGRNRVVGWSKEGVPQEQSCAATERQVVEDTGATCEQQNTAEQGSLVKAVAERLQGQGQSQLQSLDTEETIQNLELVQDAPDNEGILPSSSMSSGDDSFANSAFPLERIDQAISCAQRNGSQVAVMVIDIDALHYVSDTLGHAVNQKIGKTFVVRVKQMLNDMNGLVLAEEDEFQFSVSQLGFNKIAVMLMGLNQNEIVPSILQRIFAVQNEPVEVEGHEFYLNSNIGVSLYPVDGEDPDTLIRNACSAMREAKLNTGRNNFRFYDDEINKRYRKRIRLEAELHRALERDELRVFYQPKVDLKTGTIVGMEALLRWRHSQLGMVQPDDFIPLAEQTGLIEEISQWVISTVCQQISFWQEAGYGTVNVAVNLSPLEFRNPDLGDKIIQIVADSGIPANAIELEITETTIMQNMNTAIDILQKLNDAGFGISADDFGTGYSSLSYLKQFPLSKVKIDRSFVMEFTKDPSDAAIVSAIIAMSHSLGLRVVAEGVETEEQLRFLQDLHCDEMQGYLVSRPVTTEDVNALLARSSSIRNMILDYRVNYVGILGQQEIGSASGMISILNDFPVKDMSPIDDEISTVQGH
ncbi:MAG: EAL domain-containing protein [Amphritea sp.]